MELFFNGSVRPTEDELFFRETPSYVEVKKHVVDPPGASYVYVMPVAEHDLLVGVCLGHQFDPWIESLTDPRMGGEFFRFLKANLPVAGGLLDNALNRRYSEGALLNVQDPDTGEPVWLIVTLVGNIDLNVFSEFVELLESQRVLDAYATVMSAAFSTLAEIGSIPKRPTAASSLRLFFGSVRKDMVDVSRFTFDNLPKLIDVARTVSG